MSTASRRAGGSGRLCVFWCVSCRRVASRLTTAPIQLYFFIAQLVGSCLSFFYFRNFSIRFISSITLHKNRHGLDVVGPAQEAERTIFWRKWREWQGLCQPIHRRRTGGQQQMT